MILIFVLVIYQAAFLAAHHSTYCVNFPGVDYKDPDFKSMGLEKFPQDKTIWGRFDEGTIDSVLQYEKDGWNDQLKQAAKIGQGHTAAAKVNIYMIKYKKKDESKATTILHGWYRIQIVFEQHNTTASNLFDLKSFLKAFVLEAKDDFYRQQNVGEFVWQFPTNVTFKNNCPPNDATKYNVISCGGASKSEPLVSNTIVFARKAEFPKESEKILGDLIPNLEGKRDLNFYIRIPLQDCNQKKRIKFMVRYLIDKNANHPSHTTQPEGKSRDALRLVASFININPDHVPGIPDPLPSPTQADDLDCSDEFKLVPTADLTWADSYVAELGENINLIRSLAGCQGEYFQGRCNQFYVDILQTLDTETQSFQGINEILNQNEAEGGHTPICEHYQPLTHGFFPQAVPLYVPPKYFNAKEHDFPRTQKYLHDRSEEGRKCSDLYNGNPKCEVTIVGGSARSGDATESQPHSHPKLTFINRKGRGNDEIIEGENDVKLLDAWKNFSESDIAQMGIPFEEIGFSQLIWGMRQGHAMIMAVIAFFVMPVNIFITRYYKETFMETRILYSRVWYQIHVNAIFITGTLLFTSIVPITAARRYLGYSLTTAATCHRVFGWLTIILFCLLTLLGGFRGYTDPARKISIFVHWLLGMIIYFLVYGLMLNGLFIPGNGVSSRDQSDWEVREDDEVAYFDSAFLQVIVWLIIEVFMHGLQMLKLVVFDKTLRVTQKRIYLPVPIPVIKEHSSKNAPGYTIRVIYLCAYIFVALLSTMFYTLWSIRMNDFKNRGLGPMSCTHDPETLNFTGNLSDQCT